MGYYGIIFLILLILYLKFKPYLDVSDDGIFLWYNVRNKYGDVNYRDRIIIYKSRN